MSSLLVPIKSRMETFWYRLNPGPPEKMVVNKEREITLSVILTVTSWMCILSCNN